MGSFGTYDGGSTDGGFKNGRAIAEHRNFESQSSTLPPSIAPRPLGGQFQEEQGRKDTFPDTAVRDI